MTQLWEDQARFDSARSSMPIRRRGTPWLRQGLLIAAGLVFAADLLARLAGYAPPLLLLVALGGAFAFSYRLLALVVEPAWRLTGDVVRPPVPGAMSVAEFDHDGSDGVEDGIRIWARRMEWGLTSSRRYELTLAGRLGDLADQALRRRYGITRATDPARARQLLGERVWRAVHPPPQWMPSELELAAVVGQLAQVGREDQA
jgi:hypothetical protein